MCDEIFVSCVQELRRREHKQFWIALFFVFLQPMDNPDVIITCFIFVRTKKKLRFSTF